MLALTRRWMRWVRPKYFVRRAFSIAALERGLRRVGRAPAQSFDSPDRPQRVRRTADCNLRQPRTSLNSQKGGLERLCGV